MPRVSKDYLLDKKQIHFKQKKIPLKAIKRSNLEQRFQSEQARIKLTDFFSEKILFILE